MSVNTAEAYRIAAERLRAAEFPAPAYNFLQAEADRLDNLHQRNVELGHSLRVFLSTEHREDSELGRYAWELVNNDRKLHTPPSTESLTARDDIEN